MTEIESMTFSEYKLRITAYKLKELDREYLCYLIPFAHRYFQATKNNGKNYKYEEISDVFDIKEREKEIFDSEYGVKKKTFSSKEIELAKKIANQNRNGGF